MKRTMKKRPAAVALPQEWQQKFKASSIKVGFQLHLSRAMLEFLCAVADDCDWDRATFGDIFYPDNWIATAASLVKRGLVESKAGRDREETGQFNFDQLDKKRQGKVREADHRSYWKLTPAGLKLVELLKVAGLFTESDAAIRRKRA